MKFAFRLFSLVSFLMLCNITYAQQPENILTESSDPNEGRPLDDIVGKKLTSDKRLLPYDHVREADIFWEKRIWRVIDIREKMNLPFA